MTSALIEDMLRCSRCNSIMSSPMTLSCYHSFCQTCVNTAITGSTALDRYSNAGLSCPLCKVFTKEHDCMSNFVLNKCVDVLTFKTRLENGELSCVQCQGRDVEYKCLQCGEELCVGCAKTHNATNRCKNDRIVKISNVSLESIINMPVFCERHADQEIVLNCVECERVICQLCKVEGHNNHQVESVQVATKKVLPEVRQKIDQYSRRIKQLNNSLSSFDLESKKLDRNVSSVKKQLQEYKSQMVAKIEADCHSLCNQVDAEANNLAAEIQSKKLWAKLELAHQEGIVNWVNNITGLVNGTSLLIELQESIVPAVTSHDKKIHPEKLSIKISHISFMQNNKLSRNENILGEVGISNSSPSQLSNFQSDKQLSNGPGSFNLTRDISNYSQGTGKSFGIAEVTENRDLMSYGARLEVIQDEESEGEETGMAENPDRDGSPTSAVSMHVGQDRVRNFKAGTKQVSFVRSVITPLHEDDETLADGRVSRASDRPSRASVNLPVVPSQSNKTKAPYGRYSVNSIAPQELGWTKRKRSLERSPARSLGEDNKGANLTAANNERSFRCIIRSKYSDLTSVVCKPTGEFRIKNFHHRMCVIEDELWMPLTDENSIAIYSTAGSLLKEKLPFENVERPHALHPLNGDQILIAAENGLYILFSDNMSISLILKGNFSDVCVDKTIAVALECKQGKVYVLDFQKKPVHKTSFRINLPIVNMYKNESKLVLSDRSIFISVYNDVPLLKYDLNGKQLGEFGQWGKGAAGNMGSPKVCAVDNRGNVLVADFANSRLQVMNSSGKWSVLLTHVNHPKDAVVLEGGLLYILTDDHKVIMFRAEKV